MPALVICFGILTDLRKESCQVSAGFLSFRYFLIYEFLFFRLWDFLSLVWMW